MRVILAALLLAPVAAAAQSSLVITPTGTQNGQPAASMSDVVRSGQDKTDRVNGTSVNQSIQSDQGQIVQPASAMPINTNGAPVSPTWLGLPAFPLQRFPVVGHLQVHCDTLGWVDATGCADITANDTMPYENQGNQGGFWDASTRNSYGGQDARALGLTIYGRVPVATRQPVTSFASVSAMVANGGGFTAVSVNRIVFSTPLTPTQIAAVQPMQRVETNNAAGFFVAFVARKGLVDGSGNPLPIVASDGSSILVDTWSRPNPAVVASSTVEPSSYDSAPYTVTIDVLHQIDQIYGGWVLSPSTLPYIATAMSWEVVNYNNTSYVPSLANVLYDPRGTAVGKILEGIDAGMTSGAGSVAFDTNGNWLAAFAARNQPSAATPTIYGHICPYAFGTPSDGTATYNTECFYSAGVPGHGDAIVVQPYGNSGGSSDPVTFRVANDGTLVMAAPIVMTGGGNGITTGGQIRGGSFITPGLVVSQSSLQLNSPASGSAYQTPAGTGRLFVTGPTGTITIQFPPGAVDGQEFELDGVGGFSGLSMETTDGTGWESDSINPVTSGTPYAVSITAHRAAVWRYNATLVDWSRKS